MNDVTQQFLCGAINHPSHNFTDGLAKLPLKL